jgi:hypothetical protein
MLPPTSRFTVSTLTPAFGMPLKVTLPNNSQAASEIIPTIAASVMNERALSWYYSPGTKVGVAEKPHLMFSAVTPPPITSIGRTQVSVNWPIQGGEKEVILAWWQRLCEAHPVLQTLKTEYVEPPAPRS